MNTLSKFRFRLIAAIVASSATIGFYIPIASAEPRQQGAADDEPKEGECQVVSVGQYYCKIDGKLYYCDTKTNPDPKKNCYPAIKRPPQNRYRLPIAPGGLPLQNAPVEHTPTPQKFDPRGGVAPLGTVPLRSRGVEGEPATSAPTGQEEKATAPK